MISFIRTQIDIKYLIVISIQTLNLFLKLQPYFHFENSTVLAILIYWYVFNHNARVFCFFDVVLDLLDFISVQFNQFSDVSYHYDCRDCIKDDKTKKHTLFVHFDFSIFEKVMLDLKVECVCRALVDGHYFLFYLIVVYHSSTLTTQMFSQWFKIYHTILLVDTILNQFCLKVSKSFCVFEHCF